jgi:hypothetical protein
MNPRQTSARIAELASKTLRDPKASKRDKALAGSALAQTKTPQRRRKNRAATA